MKVKLFFTIFTVSLFFLTLTAPAFAQQIIRSNPFCTKVGGAEDSKNPCIANLGNLTFYCQGDPRWKRHPIGPNACDNLAAAGCGPTSTAMILSAYGGTMTPDQVGDLFTTQNEFICGVDGGTKMESILTDQGANDKTVRSTLGIEVAPAQLVSGGRLNMQLASQYLDTANGYLIIGSSNHYPGCGGCGHIFVVQTVVDANTVAIRDPNNCTGDGQEIQSKINIKMDSFIWRYAWAVRKLK